MQVRVTYDCDSLQVVFFLRVHGGDGHVAKDAVAHAFVGLSMMPRRSYQGVGIANLLWHDLFAVS